MTLEHNFRLQIFANSSLQFCSASKNVSHADVVQHDRVVLVASTGLQNISNTFEELIQYVHQKVERVDKLKNYSNLLYTTSNSSDKSFTFSAISLFF